MVMYIDIDADELLAHDKKKQSSGMDTHKSGKKIVENCRKYKQKPLCLITKKRARIK